MNQHEIVLYKTEDANVFVSVYYENETFWLSQKAMGELFDCSTDNISLHLKNIYAEDELSEEATAEFFSVVQKEGSREVTEVSHADALEKAEKEYAVFRIRQDHE